MRQPKDIQIGDRTLADVLDDHARWLRNEGGKRALLCGADLRGAVLHSADLRDAFLHSADLRCADLYSADLSGAVLRRADLRDAFLHSADLRDADLYSAVLRCADLYSADLHSAVLRDADLSGAFLRRAVLHSADLCYADLHSANLFNADLRGTELWGCIGNSLEIHTVQTDLWPVTYTATVMQIGCQRHDIDEWWDFDDRYIDSMDEGALDWWRIWKPILRQIIDVAPATPTGHED